MGTGNYSHPEGRTVNVDVFDGIDHASEDAEWDRESAFDDFLMVVSEEMPDSFERLYDRREWRRDHRDCRVLARNGMFEVWLHVDSYDHHFLTYGLRQDIGDRQRGMAEAVLYSRAEKFFDAVQEAFPGRVYVATSAWTSALRGK